MFLETSSEDGGSVCSDSFFVREKEVQETFLGRREVQESCIHDVEGSWIVFVRSKRSPATFFKGTDNGHDKLRCRITNVTSSFHTDTNDLLKACKDELRTGWGAALLGAGAFLLSHFVWKLRPWPLVSTVPLLGLVCSQGF